MIAPLAKFLDWLAIQLVWGRRCRSLLKLQGSASGPRLEEAIQFFKGEDLVPTESLPARPEFKPAGSGEEFHFATPRLSRFAENNVVYGRLYRCAEHWKQRPAIILLHGAGGDPDYHYEFPGIARHCNRMGFNAVTLMGPFQFQRRPRDLATLHWPDYLFEAQICYAQAIAEIRAFLGWLLEEGCPTVAVWGNSYGGALAGLAACYEARLSAAVLSAPGLSFDVFLSAARHVVWPGLREELLKQQPACEALNETVLNLTVARPCIPKDKILLVEAIYDLFVPRESMEALWQAWGQPEIWRLPHSHASRSLSPGLTGRILDWLAPRLEKPVAKASSNPQSGANGRQPFSSETNQTPAAAASRRSP
jgi:pimeloyl-ACP methyl ester carboxylesterase